jgi:hypothetical protein
MIDEDKALAQELGLDGLSQEVQTQQISNFYKTLHLRISMALEDLLTDEQLEEFGQVNESGDEATEAWFKQAVPNYDQIVEEQTEGLKSDIKQNAERIRSAIDETQ